MKNYFVNSVVIFLFIAICFDWVISVRLNSQKKFVCYYGSWSVYRHSKGKFLVENIDPSLCTHIVYSFFGITTAGNISILDPYLDLEENWGRGNIAKFNGLKEKNPNLKTIAAVGGWNEGSSKFSKVANDASLRKLFAQNAVEFVKKHNFNGLDLDWEYPAQRDGNPSVDKKAFTLFVEEISKLFKANSLIFSAAVASAEFSASQSYDIPAITKFLDFISVMTYDLHGSWEKTVGINSPLYVGPSDISDLQKQLNVNASVNYWLSQGLPREKLVVGIPLYGRTFNLANSKQTQPGSPSNGPGMGGPYTSQPGMIGFNELCAQQSSWTTVWDDKQKVPYAYKENDWVGYDDVKSVTIKSDYINSMNLGGAMVWSIETDDFLGECGSAKYPLMTTIQSIVIGNSAIPTTEKPTTTTNFNNNSTYSTTTASTITTTNPSSNGFDCSNKKGYFRDPTDCTVFYYCDDLEKYTFKCPNGLYFEVSNTACDWPNNVAC